MKKILAIFLWILIFCSSLFAKSPDSLFFFHELTFNSTAEKVAFSEYEKNGFINYFEMAWFSTGNSDTNSMAAAQRSIEDFIDQINAPGFAKSKPVKKVKKIYRSVHSTFLKKYELNADFDKLFDQGTYNCATATFLYGCIFQLLDMPFSIKLRQDHVYLIAFPDKESIVVETTNPYRGLFILEQNTKEDYVKFLADSKLISQEEYQSVSIDSLFYRFYFLEKKVSLKELSGVLYYNFAIKQIENGELEKAYQNIQKAYFLFPSHQISFLVLGVSSMLLYQWDHSDLSYTPYLYQLTRLPNSEFINAIVEEIFSNATYSMLIENGNMPLYDEFYSLLTDQISDTLITEQLSFTYHYEKGRVLFNRMNYEESLNNMEFCMELKPKHTDVQHLFTNALNNYLGEISNPEEYASQVNEYFDKYPSLQENSLLVYARNNSLLEAANRYFMLGDIKKGKYNLELFEQKFKNSDNLGHALDIFIVKAYSAAAAYYFRKGNSKEARKYIDKGLLYVPENFELLYRKKALE